MKLSQIPKETIRQLPPKAINTIVFGDWSDGGETGDVAFVLGANPKVLPERARIAANLYKAGRAKYLMPCGGVEWDTDRGRMSEGAYLALCLKELGVPEEAILLEDQSRTTHENMVCGTLLTMRVLNIRSVNRILIVTSPSHLRRSLVLGGQYLPRMVKFSGYTEFSGPEAPGNWEKDPFYADRIFREAELLHTAVGQGWCEDIEF